MATAKNFGYKNKSNESTKVVLKIDIETCDDPKQLQIILTHLIQNIASDSEQRAGCLALIVL